MKKISLLAIFICCFVLIGCSNLIFGEFKQNPKNWSIKTEEKAKELYPKYISFIDDCIKEIGINYSEQIICNHIDGICSNSHENCFYTKKYIFSKDLFITVQLRFGTYTQSEKTPCTYRIDFNYAYYEVEGFNSFPVQIFTALEKIEKYCCWGVAGEGLKYVSREIDSYFEIFKNVKADYFDYDFNGELKDGEVFALDSDCVFYVTSTDRIIFVEYNNGFALKGWGELSLTDENIV